LAAFGVIVTLAASRAGHARELGIDVSTFQGSTGVPQANWNQLAAGGRAFAYAKATEGLNPPGNIDSAWANNVERARAAGVLAGVYHFARPDNRPTTAGAVQEADQFVNVAGAAMNAGYLRPVIDVQRRAANMTPAALSNWVLAFVDEVVRLKGPAAEPIVYCDTSYAADAFDGRVANLDLWIADRTGLDPQTAAPSTTGVFADWTIWQYAIGNAGGLSGIDLDVVHAEASPLSSLVIPEPGSVAAFALVGLATLRRRGP
jgi:GH25 family lysozyme M1 (1,4-beta-N-acetylmuramidase)